MSMIARSLLLLCVLLVHAVQAKEANPAQGLAGVQVKDNLVTIDVKDQDPFELALRLQGQTSLRLENLEVLKGTPPILLQYKERPLRELLDILAANADVSFRCEAGRLCRFGTREESRRSRAVYEAWKQALSEDSADLRSLEEAWVDFLRPPEQGPAQLDMDAWDELVTVARKQGDMERAIMFLRMWVENAKRVYGDHSGEYGIAIAKHALAQFAAGKDPALLQTMERGIALAEAEFGKVNVRLAETQLALAEGLSDLGRWPDAEAMYRRSIESLGARVPAYLEVEILAPSVSGLALALDMQDRWAEAIPMYERSIRLHHADIDKPMAALVGERLGSALYQLGRFAEATQAFKDVAKIRPLRDQPKLQLQVMELLGDVSSETAPSDALDRMRRRAAANKDVSLKEVASYLLLAHSRRQFKEAPQSEAWQRTCAAFGVLFPSSVEGSDADPEKREWSEAECRRQARAATP